MIMKKNARTIMITGTSRGIGRFLAEYYIDRGYKVIGCSRSPGSFSHEQYMHYNVDVSNEAQIKQMVQEVSKTHNGIDILINNAGLASMNYSILTPLSTVNKLLGVNFVGVFLMVREVAKLMMTKKWGRIVNFSTVAVPLSLEGEAIYAASKSAVETFTKVLAKELASFDITCNVVGPAPIRTDLIKNVPEQKINKIIETMAIKRLGEFSDVANVIDFYIDEKSDYITGQTIYLGGI